MLYCELINEKGDALQLTRDNGYTIIEVQGLNPATATVSRQSRLSLSGSAVSNIHVEERNINIIMYLLGDPEQARLRLYQFCSSGDFVSYRVVGDNRDLTIDGYIEDIQVAYFEEIQRVEITIVCPHPYFRETEEQFFSLAKTEPCFEFIFENPVGSKFELGQLVKADYVDIDYTGDVPTGMTIKLTCNATVSNPKILNNSTGEFLGLQGTLNAGDIVTITTSNGKKKITLESADGIINAFNRRIPNSSWLQLRKGNNNFSLDAMEGLASIEMEMSYHSEFVGV